MAAAVYCLAQKHQTSASNLDYEIPVQFGLMGRPVAAEISQPKQIQWVHSVVPRDCQTIRLNLVAETVEVRVRTFRPNLSRKCEAMAILAALVASPRFA